MQTGNLFLQAQTGHVQLIVFTRFPEAGRTKTRLIPALGPEGAAHLQRRLIEQTVATARELARLRNVRLVIQYCDSELKQMRLWLDPENNMAFRPQAEGDLGQRMNMAASEAFAQGAKRFLLIGTDIPGLSAALLARAFDLLITHDLVLGPAVDGGYYLIGLTRPEPALFAGIEWGTGTVFSATLVKAATLNLTVAQLEPLTDVDRPEDLEHLNHHSDLK